MNKGISTPNDCAMHIQEALSRRSVVALVNGQPWAMRRPLEGTEEGGTECHLVLHHMKVRTGLLKCHVRFSSS